MVDRERRKQGAQAALRGGLAPQQLATLRTLQEFGWTLRFVRRPMFLDPVPIVFSADGARFLVLEPDGSINEDPGFKLRPD